MSKAKDRKPADQTREERLKSALKANMARRKAQAKAKVAAASQDEASETAPAGSAGRGK